MSLVTFARANLLCLLLCSCAIAEGPLFVQTMHDKIPLYGTQGESALVVEAGQTVELTGERTELDLLVRGTLRLLPGLHLKCRTITAVDGGTIDITEPATITIRDMPLNTEMDPSQYGHGLLVVNGNITTHAPSWRQAYAQLAAEINAGDSTLTLAVEPHGWQPGDKLVLPDTRQPTSGADLSAQTEAATIAGIDGTTVTLTAPVAFNHHGWRKSDGTVGLLPDIANLTQPIVIRSENPNGVRGHVLITAASHQDVEGVALVDMGRTTHAPLHSTLRDDQGNLAQIGTNQIGRYAWHHHHLLGRRNNGLDWQFRFQHCSVDSSPKWGVAIHGSHFGLVDDCATYDCAGSGIVTEDPWVYGNKITNNIVIAKQPGSGVRITRDSGGRAGRNDPAGDFWHDRGGLGLTSAMNEITGNRLYCCKESIGMAGFATTMLYKPKEPGVCPTCSEANRIVFANHMGYQKPDPKRYPFVFDTSGNVAWGGVRGIETWTADCYVDREKMFPGLAIVHCQEPTAFFDQEETVLHEWRILGNGTLGTNALNWKDGYRFGITAIDCEVRGCGVVYRAMQDSEYTRFIGGSFEGPVFIYQAKGQIRRLNNPGANGWAFSAEGCDLSGMATFIDGTFPRNDLLYWFNDDSQSKSLTPMSYALRPWKDGRDLNVYHYQQKRDFALPVRAKAYGDWPVGVNTHAQLIALGTPIFGDVMPDSAVLDPSISRWYWADDVTPCSRKVELLEQRIRELEGN